MPRARGIAFLGDEMYIALDEGTVVTLPVTIIPNLWVASQRERCQAKITSDGEVIEWASLGEILRVEELTRLQVLSGE